MWLKPAAACCRYGLDLWGVVNSGGFGGEIATPMDTDIAAFDEAISVNARGVLLVTRYWSSRMLGMGPNARYADVMERALYNGSISGLSQDGSLFFYENSAAQPQRSSSLGPASMPLLLSA